MINYKLSCFVKKLNPFNFCISISSIKYIKLQIINLKVVSIYKTILADENGTNNILGKFNKI